MKVFLKQRNMYYMKYWCQKVSDADISVFCCNSIIDSEDLLDKEKLIKEKDASQQLLYEYQLFYNELDEVEKVVLLSYVYDKPIPPSMNAICYENIKVKVYKKWCMKFLSDNLIYIHDLDVKKLGELLREARRKKYLSANNVAEFLGITESSIRNYEIGRRTPGINVLYALCELYEIDIKHIINLSIGK